MPTWWGGYLREEDGSLVVSGSSAQVGDPSSGSVTVTGGLDPDTTQVNAVSVTSDGTMAVQDTAPAYSTGSMGGATVNQTSTTTGLPASSSTRRELHMQNDGPSDVWVNATGTGAAVVGQGIYLAAFGGSMSVFFRGTVAAIANGANAHVCWTVY